MKNQIYFLFIFILFLLQMPVFSVDRSIFNDTRKGNYITQPGEGSFINWTSGYISASASVKIPKIIFNPDHPDFNKEGTALSLTDARSDARAKAKELAELKLMETILAMKLDADHSVRSKMKEDLFLRERIGFLTSKFIIKSEKSSNGILTLDLALPFKGNGGLYSVIAGSYYNSESIPEFPETVIRQDISAVIIDLSEFKDFRAVIEPRILTDQGRLIYGPETLRQEIAVERGLVSYHINHKNAVQDSRAGLKPYYLYASSVQSGNIYLDSEEVKRILSSPSGKKAFRQGKIVLIMPD